MRTAFLAVVAGLLLAAASPASAQTPAARQADCQEAFRKLDAEAVKTITDGDFCRGLAGFIVFKWTGPGAAAIVKSLPEKVLSPRDVQSRSTDHADLGGTAGQGQAVPGVQPAGVAAGTIAMVGTDAGRDAIAALSVNPAVLFLAEKATSQLAKLSRVADVTVFVPISSTGDEDVAAVSSDSKLRYFGARVRFNWTGVSSGSSVWAKAEEMLKDRISKMAVTGTRVSKLLVDTINVEACTIALLDNPLDDTAITAACGAPVGFRPDLAQARSINDELVRIRRVADAKYFGADFRFDSGDPTLGAVENASGQFMFLGLALGRRFDAGDPASTATSGIRARVGVRHAKLDSQPKAEFAVEASVGYELSRRMADDNALEISAGFEIRRTQGTSTAPEEFQADYTMLRASLTMPLLQGAGVSLNLATPITGDVTPTISVNFNWGLLLSNRPGR
jgi:hypothetical protein